MGKMKYLIAFIFLFSACATTKVELPPEPPKYVYENRITEYPAVNSLWRESASLYEDPKARRLNDLVTIRVVENIIGSGKADTNTNKKSSLDVNVEKFLGVPTNLGFNNLYGKGNTFSPSVKGSAENDFQGSGETTREGRLVGTITAKVVAAFLDLDERSCPPLFQHRGDFLESLCFHDILHPG